MDRTELNSTLPVPRSSFVGRRAELDELSRIVRVERMVTLTGAGGAGKTRLAVALAGRVATEFPDGPCYVDLAPIVDPDLVVTTVAHLVGVPDQPGRSPLDALCDNVADRHVLLVLDNCEHLLAVCAELIAAVLDAGPGVTVLATSREPIGVDGELAWRVPPLSLSGEAMELFVERAWRVRPEFTVSRQDSEIVAEICRRLDGLPLAIELAAARVRSLSVAHILENLEDRFRLLTGGARTTLPRHHTLRASLDWSYELLVEPERRFFVRLGVFPGSFDLDAARAVCADPDDRHAADDLLRVLVDKSLVVAEDAAGTMRYRLLETMRDYAARRFAESDEADVIRGRHRDHYLGRAIELAARDRDDDLVAWADVELDHLRAAYAWSRDRGDAEQALRFASALQQFWIMRGRLAEGLAWFSAVVTDRPEDGMPRDVWARGIADRCIVLGWLQLPPTTIEQARYALAIARELDDPPLIASLLRTCSVLTQYDLDVSWPYLDEAAQIGRRTGDERVLCQARLYQSVFLDGVTGDPRGGRDAAAESGRLALVVGDRMTFWHTRIWLGCALHFLGELDDAARALLVIAEDGAASAQVFLAFLVNVFLGRVRASQGRAAVARMHADAASEAAAKAGGLIGDALHGMIAETALCAGDGPAARCACDDAWRFTYPSRMPFTRMLIPMSEALLAEGDLVAARRWSDETVAVLQASHLGVALATRAHVALAQGEPERAARDACEALTLLSESGAFLRVPITLECLARLGAAEGRSLIAVRLFGAAQAIREDKGIARWPVFAVGYDDAVARCREALGDNDFDTAWQEGAALSVSEAIAYALRGRAGRSRPTTGWDALTPTELDVVRQVRAGLTNRDVAARLLMSPRTVQTHLTHVYTKLGLASRLQLVQEAERHT